MQIKPQIHSQKCGLVADTSEYLDDKEDENLSDAILDTGEDQSCNIKVPCVKSDEEVKVVIEGIILKLNETEETLMARSHCCV